MSMKMFSDEDRKSPSLSSSSSSSMSSLKSSTYSSSNDYDANINFSSRFDELHPREYCSFIQNNILSMGYPSYATVDELIQQRSLIESHLNKHFFYSKGLKSIYDVNQLRTNEEYKPAILKTTEITPQNNPIDFQLSSQSGSLDEAVYLVPLSLDIDSLRSFYTSRCVPTVFVLFHGYHFVQHDLPARGSLEYNHLDSPILEPGAFYINLQDSDAVAHENRRVRIDKQNHHEDIAVKKVDWVVPLDLTPYIQSMCTILDDEPLNKFLEDKSESRKLSVEKNVSFNFEQLETYAVTHARNLGYLGKVATQVVVGNASPRVITLVANHDTKSGLWSNLKSFAHGTLSSRTQYSVIHKPKEILLSVAHKFPYYGEQGQAPSTAEIVKSLQDMPNY